MVVIESELANQGGKGNEEKDSLVGGEHFDGAIPGDGSLCPSSNPTYNDSAYYGSTCNDSACNDSAYYGTPTDSTGGAQH
ncbi:MAG: hypothetical protein A2Z28_04540 [Chloroflexi bacterium RBG_16_51_9]|nr:MAG: hypothetical protein A2Z28_04540 [Chloroflexi bacterium RBG_16_51_9]